MHKRILSLVFILFMSQSSQALAQVKVEQAHARATFEGAMSSAAYMTIINQGDSDVRLVSAEVSAAVAEEVQLHTTVMQDDMMRMVHMEEGIVIPAGSAIALKPGGYHIMLMGLKQGLTAGEQLPITLHFDTQEAVTLEAAVKHIDKGQHHHHH